MTERSAGAGEDAAKRRGPLIVLFTAAVIAVGAGVFAITQQPQVVGGSTASPSASESPATTTPTPGAEGDEGTDETTLASSNVLDEPKSGQEAIDALGDKIDVVAERNGMTVDELTHLLLTDSTANVSVTGSIFYRDTHTPQG